MKKIIFSLSALAALLLAGSCQRENLEPVQQGGTVTYTVQVPQDIATKADGDDVFTLHYEVYRENVMEETAPVYEGTEDFLNGSANVELEFVKDQNFVVLFWAQKKDAKVYDIKDLRKVSISKAQKLVSNNFDAEVFAGNDLVENCASKKGGNVVLVRPVAQLNIATDAEGLYLGTTPVVLDKSYVKVTGLSATYNVYKGYGSTETANAAYGMADVPTGTVTVGTESYTYVAMNYIGFMPQDDITVHVDFTIQTSEGNINHTVSNVPVKANYKTNIIGNLISATDDYTVTLSQQWEDEEYTKVVVSTAVDLQTEVNNIPDGETGVITLGGNIDFGNLVGTLTRAASDPASLIIPANKTVVLDLNGFTLSQTAKQTGAHSMIVNNGNLTIVDNKGNGKISYSDTGNGGEYGSNTIVNNGRLVIESGVIENNSSATVASNGYPHPIDNNGELIINGGTLTNNANYASMRIWCTTDDNTSVTINGGTFNGSIDFQTPSAAANKGTLTINGGTFNPDTYTESSVRLLGFGADVDEMFGYIKGGTFNGSVKINKYGAVQELNSQVFYITGGQFSNDPSAFVVDGYPVIAPETDGGYYTIGKFVAVAKIDDQEYGSLRAAVAAAQEGDTIILIKDIEQADGVIITDKNLTIDLNDKIFTVSEGANTNNRNFKVNGSSVVTIKNGTMVADGEITRRVYVTVRTEDTAKVTLDNVKSYSYRGYGLNIKANAGTAITINNSVIYAQYGGGVEAAGGVIELNNVKIVQNGVDSSGAWCSVAIGVNGGGKVTVNSGEYSAAAISTDSNAAQGTWVAYVMSSGGTLDIKGGTFNGTVAETAAAANACGLICADTKAVVNIYDGTFNSNGAILDMRNNTGGSPNPVATLYGGTFSADPTVSGLYGSNLISVAEGYVVKEENGEYNVVEYKPVAKVGNTEYGSIDEAIAAWTNGSTLALLDDVTLSDVVTLKSTEHHILDLGTYTMTAAEGKNAFVIQACGTGDDERNAITIKADTTTPGGINAGNKCIVYYKYADGGISGNDRPIIKIEGGVFTGSTSSWGTAGIYTIGTAARKCATLNITGGTFNCSINGSSKSKLLISGGVFNCSVGSQGDSTALRLIWGGKFKTLGFMTADDNNTKFWFGSEMAKSNVGVYVDKDGYLVVGGPVITEPGDKFETEPKSYSSWSSYLKYSSAATYGLYYEK